MNRRLLFGGATLALSFASAMGDERRIGPSYACSPAAYADGLTRMICERPDLSREEMSLAQVYFVRRFVVGRDGREALMHASRAVSASIRSTCGMPKEGAADQTMPPGAAACYVEETERNRKIWLQSLTGAALEEAARPVEQNIALQQRLADLGFLPASVKQDGVFGDATRNAIMTWQRSSNRPDVSGFLSSGDGVALWGAENGSMPKSAIQSDLARFYADRDRLDAPDEHAHAIEEGSSSSKWHDVEKAVDCFQQHYVRSTFSSADDDSTARLNLLCHDLLAPIKSNCAASGGEGGSSLETADTGVACDLWANTLATMFLREKDRRLQTIDAMSVVDDLIDAMEHASAESHP